MAIPIKRSLPANNLPEVPGPRRRFLIGSSLEFQHDPLAFILQAARRYGDVATYQIANVQLYQVNHPDGIQRVLLDNRRNYVKGKYWDAIRLVGGNGLLSSEGSLWLHQRRLIQPAFHLQRIAGFAQMIVEHARHMLDRWEPYARSGQPLDIYQEFTLVTMQTITEAMFSIRLEGENQALRTSIHKLLKEMYFRFAVPWYPGLDFPTFRNFRTRRTIGVVDELIYRIIRDRRLERSDRQDLLGMLMAVRDEETGEAMPEQQLRDELVTLFIAGHETTALSLSWLCHLLSTEPEWQARLKAEIDQVLQGRPPAFEDLQRMPTLGMVVDETLRLYPSIWMTYRNSVEEDEVCGMRIPAGVVVGIPPYVIHRLAEFWPDPEKFDPQRFTRENSEGRARYTYIPFGAGPRLCIGNNFARVETQLIAATLLQRYSLQAIPGEKVATRPLITLHPKGSLWMRVENR